MLRHHQPKSSTTQAARPWMSCATESERYIFSVKAVVDLGINMPELGGGLS